MEIKIGVMNTGGKNTVKNDVIKYMGAYGAHTGSYGVINLGE